MLWISNGSMYSNFSFVIVFSWFSTIRHCLTRHCEVFYYICHHKMFFLQCHCSWYFGSDCIAPCMHSVSYKYLFQQAFRPLIKDDPVRAGVQPIQVEEGGALVGDRYFRNIAAATSAPSVTSIPSVTSATATSVTSTTATTATSVGPPLILVIVVILVSPSLLFHILQNMSQLQSNNFRGAIPSEAKYVLGNTVMCADFQEVK